MPVEKIGKIANENDMIWLYICYPNDGISIEVDIRKIGPTSWPFLDKLVRASPLL
jgi:hypothetical protein